MLRRSAFLSFVHTGVKRWRKEMEFALKALALAALVGALLVPAAEDDRWGNDIRANAGNIAHRVYEDPIIANAIREHRTKPLTARATSHRSDWTDGGSGVGVALAAGVLYA